MSELLTPEWIDLSRSASAEFLCLPLPPAPMGQLLNEVALELQVHLGYLMLFWSEEALPPDIASDHIRAIGARFAEIAMLMPRVETARASERVAADALGAASAPAPTQPENRLGELEPMVGTAYERALDTCHQADVLRITAEGIYFAFFLAKRLTRNVGSPGFGVDDRTEFALAIPDEGSPATVVSPSACRRLRPTSVSAHELQRRLARRHWPSARPPLCSPRKLRRGPNERNEVPLIDD